MEFPAAATRSEAKVCLSRLRSLLFFLALPLLLSQPNARRSSHSPSSGKEPEAASVLKVSSSPRVFLDEAWRRSIWREGLFLSGFLVGAVAAPKGKDYYKILGVRRNATQRQIDKAYRKKAKRLHPDIAPGKEKEFMEVAKAHEVLSDPEQRKRYDQFGEEGVSLGEAANSMGGQFPFDVFQQFFGGGDFGAGFGGGGARKGGGGGHAKFSFGGGPMPDYMKEFGFGDPPAAGEEEDIDANLYDKEPFVQELTPDNYKEFIEGREHVVLVETYNPHCGPCRDFKYEYSTAANVLEGAIPFAAVNCRNHPKLPLCRQARRYPSVFFFGAGGGDSPVMYTGKKSVVFPDSEFKALCEEKYEDMNSWLTQMIPVPVTELSIANMEDWLARDASRPKIVFFSNKKPFSAVWAITAYQYRTQMSFGVVYPGSKAVLERYFTTPTPFNGGKGTPHVAFPIWLQINDLDTLDGEWVKVRGLKPQELNQTLSRIAAHFCIVLILPSRKAAWGAARTVYTALKDLAAKYKRDPVKLVWVDAEKQVLEPVESAADVEQFIDRVLSGSNLTEKVGGPAPRVVDLLSRQSGRHDEL